MNFQPTAEIVSAYIGNNVLDPGTVPDMISLRQTHRALDRRETAPETLTPAVPIKRSVTDDYIVCLGTGRS